MRDYDIKSDLKQEQFQTLKLVQGDRGNKIKINVFEEGQPVNLTGCSITAKYKRQDGIKVNGTDIDFPVVKGTDNSYYLTHNFDKEKNKAGWIFADYRNKFDGTDKNIIIYGHNMKNGSMFASLKDVIKEEWYNNENNKYIALITENENCKYQVFSVYQIETEEYYLQTNISNFKEFVEKIKGRSKKKFNVDIKETDSILTLSTCADNTKYRVVLHAVKIK